MRENGMKIWTYKNKTTTKSPTNYLSVRIYLEPDQTAMSSNRRGIS